MQFQRLGEERAAFLADQQAQQNANPAARTPLVLDGRTEPALLGLPFPLWWTAGWVVAAFGALAALHLSLGGESDE